VSYNNVGVENIKPLF